MKILREVIRQQLDALIVRATEAKAEGNPAEYGNRSAIGTIAGLRVLVVLQAPHGMRISIEGRTGRNIATNSISYAVDILVHESQPPATQSLTLEEVAAGALDPHTPRFVAGWVLIKDHSNPQPVRAILDSWTMHVAPYSDAVETPVERLNAYTDPAAATKDFQRYITYKVSPEVLFSTSREEAMRGGPMFPESVEEVEEPDAVEEPVETFGRRRALPGYSTPRYVVGFTRDESATVVSAISDRLDNTVAIVPEAEVATVVYHLNTGEEKAVAHLLGEYVFKPIGPEADGGGLFSTSRREAGRTGDDPGLMFPSLSRVREEAETDGEPETDDGGWTDGATESGGDPLLIVAGEPVLRELPTEARQALEDWVMSNAAEVEEVLRAFSLDLDDLAITFQRVARASEVGQ